MVGGLLLIFAAFYTSQKAKSVPEKPFTVDEKTGEALSTSFANEPVSVDKKLLEAPKKQTIPKSPPIRIVIPSLNIDLPVRQAKIVNGFWEVFTDSAGFGLGSAFPEDDEGNQVIFAHARQGLFGPLKDIKTGANITVMTQNQWYSYTVDNIKEVLPSQTEVIAPTEDPILTLYTCSGYADSKRLIVTATKNTN
ncbi:hypothetical protein A3D78_00625 [Candidatus Gottesmanbacteria bacterium RIFCSPHIGHO2_02_FULL_39_14]|uniref:Sortase n=2 Tax=Candidatus Gottesmaniibacteriota TaxID=1752720 RepID=A0A1F5ZWG7_9BACT|nr:MAG: hypothetical protein A3D78_00625 [Candidatus Gottesmanbacteria bacterium RIFCSPHIGHO2_02_FULL_39_14]OGG30885.1 MAG: hypothetical protein A3I51_04760 [Candidatus Gottesmanbacteria bacterium RIFCSPLOWO2_02_FULL_38_8]